MREYLRGIVKGRIIEDKDDPVGVNCRAWPICLKIMDISGLYVRIGKVRDKSLETKSKSFI